MGTKVGDGVGGGVRSGGKDARGVLGKAVMGEGGEEPRAVVCFGIDDVVGRGEGGEGLDRVDRAIADERGGEGGESIGERGLGEGEIGVNGGESGDVGVGGSDGGGDGEGEARDLRVDAARKASGWRWTRGAGMAYTVMVFSCSPAQHQQGMSRYHEQAEPASALRPSKTLTGGSTVCGSMQNWGEGMLPANKIASSIATTETVQDSPILSRVI